MTCPWFDHGQARLAAEFHAGLIPDSFVGPAMRAGADYPAGVAGEELTVEFSILGRTFIGLNGGPGFPPNEAVSFQVITGDQAEADKYLDAIIGHGGCESSCGWRQDF